MKYTIEAKELTPRSLSSQNTVIGKLYRIIPSPHDFMSSDIVVLRTWAGFVRLEHPGSTWGVVNPLQFEEMPVGTKITLVQE